MKTTQFVLSAALAFAAVAAAAEAPPYPVDPARVVDGEYRGRFTPDAKLVLSGEFARLFKLPQVPFRFLGKEEGYRAESLTPVPPPGVHPRVLMSPDDIERIRAEVAKGDKADRWFQEVWNEIKEVKPLDQHHGLTSPALVALVTKDEKRGRELVEILVAQARLLEPMGEIMNTHPFMAPIRDNWYYYARMSVEKVGGVFYRDAYEQGGAARVRELARQSVEFTNKDDPKSGGCLFNTVLRDYDYLHSFMTEEERALVRRVIASLTAGKYTTGMEIPGNMFINNHMSMGEDLLILHLAIEGEEGYDPRILREYSPTVRNALTYMVSPDGTLFEKCKGFIPERAALAISRRAGDPASGALPLLSHDHLKAMVWAKAMDAVNVYYGDPNVLGVPRLGELDEAQRHWWMGYGSGPWMDQFLNWAFLLKHVYPRDPVVDFFYKERLFQHGFGPPRPTPGAPLSKPKIRYVWRDLMLLTATDGLRRTDGEVIDYNQDELPAELLARTTPYVDLRRGVAASRSSWDKNALHVHYECRSDVFVGGHETPEAGDFNLVSHGVIWSMRRNWYMDASFRNTVLVDGYAGIWPATCGRLMAVEDSPHATTFVSDNTDQYNWSNVGKNFYSWHNCIKDNPFEAKQYPGGKWGRDWEVPFQPHMRDFHENLAGLDWGAWHGESRGPDMYQKWNDIDHAFRTVHMTKGANPYVLVIDDIRKDSERHQYDWVLHLESDITLCEADSSVRNRYLRHGMPDDRSCDLILCRRDTREQRLNNYGLICLRQPAAGDPMLLVRVLWRESAFAFPQPSFEQGYGTPMVRVPANAVDPEFRVLLFPHRFGAPLPVTQWNSDRTALTVTIDGRSDVYSFGRTDRGRTLLAMTRDGAAAAATPAGPAAPAVDTVFGWTPDRNDRDPVRTILLSGSGAVTLRASEPGVDLRYTLDGSIPNAGSPRYAGPITIGRSCRLTAKTFARHWPFREDRSSEVLRLDVVCREPSAPPPPAGAAVDGLACEVFEIHQTIFDPATGIFTGRTSTLPSLQGRAPLSSCRMPGVVIPPVTPAAPATEMNSGYYRFSGFIDLEGDGAHGFRVGSCGPVSLTVGGQSVIAVTGVYGLSHKDRFGEAALRAGRHPFELVVCDPVFWKDGREGEYVVTLAHLPPGQTAYRPLAADRFHTMRADLPMHKPPTAPTSAAVAAGDTVPGLVMSRFDRTSLARAIPLNGLPLEHFRIAPGEKPYQQRPTLALEPSDNAACLIDYEGYFIADVEGEYEFALDENGGNELVIGGVPVVRNRVAAPRPAGKIHLTAGCHAVAVRLAQSQAGMRVRTPGSDRFVPATIGMFARPADAAVMAEPYLVCHLDCEKIDDGVIGVTAAGGRAALSGASLDDGRSGKGVRFAGKGARLLLDNIPSPDDALTLSCWLRVDTPGDGWLVAGTFASHPELRLRGTVLAADYYRGSPIASFDLKKADIKPGTWCHVAVAWGQEVRVYVNGQLKAAAAKNVPERNAHVRDLELFSGLEVTVDDVRIYNAALTPEQIKDVYGR